jgi:hypothetical protein
VGRRQTALRRQAALQAAFHRRRHRGALYRRRLFTPNPNPNPNPNPTPTLTPDQDTTAAFASASTWSEPLVAVAAQNLRPALYYAAINGRPDELAAALQRGARLAWTDMGKGRSALWVAAYYGEDECLRLLLEAGASVEPRVESGLPSACPLGSATAPQRHSATAPQRGSAAARQRGSAAARQRGSAAVRPFQTDPSGSGLPCALKRRA